MGASASNCASTPVDPGAGWQAGEAPCALLALPTTIRLSLHAVRCDRDYAGGTSTQANVHEVHTGLTGFIEFSSWGQNGRPDLAV